MGSQNAGIFLHRRRVRARGLHRFLHPRESVATLRRAVIGGEEVFEVGWRLGAAGRLPERPLAEGLTAGYQQRLGSHPIVQFAVGGATVLQPKG